MDVQALIQELYSIKGLEHPYALLLMIPLIILLFILIRFELPNQHFQKEFLKRRKRFRVLMFFSRMVILSLLVIALAAPYGEMLKTIESDPKITVLLDNSTSMQVMDTSFVDPLISELQDYLPVTLGTLASGSESAIGDGILSNLEQDKNILLITDGRNNAGTDLTDVALLAAGLNASLSAVDLSPAVRDASVSIAGPSKAVSDVESRYAVRVSMVGVENYKLTVTVDGEEIIDLTSEQSLLEFSWSFTEGTHEIVARVEAEGDTIPMNDVFYKVVRVVEKPEILYINKKDDPLDIIVETLYDVTEAAFPPPSGYDKYYAAIVNDVPVSNLPNSDALAQFVLEGNGLVAVGGYNSFEYGSYEDSVFEAMLPVNVGGAKLSDEGDRANIVLLIDISTSTSGKVSDADYTISEIEKALALDIVDQLKDIHNLAVIAFHEDVFMVSELSALAGKRPDVKDRISRLKEGGKSTIFSNALEAGYKVLKDVGGSRNMIIISDGRAKDSVRQNLDYADLLDKEHIKLYTVGTDVREIYTKYFMQDLAERTNGVFFEPTASNRIKLIFGPPDEDTKEDTEGVYSANILNSYHFITQGLSLDATMYGYNQVVPKASAKLLATLDNGAPLLTVSRYGLGRSAAITAFGGPQGLGELLNKKNSRLISRTMNWAIGDPERKEPFSLSVDDARAGTRSKVILRSERTPDISEVIFEKTGEDLYEGYIAPSSPGFYEILGTRYAVNYPVEFQHLGLDASMANSLALTGGKIFKSDEAPEIVELVKTYSKRKQVQRQTIIWPFVISALVILLAEITYRRVRDFILSR